MKWLILELGCENTFLCRSVGVSLVKKSQFLTRLAPKEIIINDIVPEINLWTSSVELFIRVLYCGDIFHVQCNTNIPQCHLPQIH